MQRNTALSLLVGAVVTLRGFAAQGQASLTAGALRVGVSKAGMLIELRNTTTGINYLDAGHATPLLTLVSGGERYLPTSLSSSGRSGPATLTVQYAKVGVRIVLRARQTPTHLALEIVSTSPERNVDAVVWGPYATTINTTVGEIIGVVRDPRVALGMQVLNMKTLGGDLPNNEGSTWARGIAATAHPWGSTLQAYAINRSRDRVVDAWGGNYHNMPVPAIANETVVGSAIALFTCPATETLDRMEQIELAEGLPHPTVDGVWWRKSPVFERSYMISSFGESDIDEMIAYTTRAGLMSLYHEGPFKSWGHFVLDDVQFPNGRSGMKRAVEKARTAGLHLGVHTLTNFINTNDPYVTPIPDDRLSVTGASVLVRDIDTRATEIEVRSPAYFADETHNYLHTVKIGSELIQYRAVTAQPPFRLLDCQRGAFGTTAAPHHAGSVIAKLLDHSYKVFFPNFAMQREVASNLAAFLNETGVDHIDFDGHEGALASGQGDYALAVFANDVLRQTHHDLINGTSISKTFYWHIGSYYNWGEPWNGGFTESMQQYRIDNQALFDRNFMPHMLGWYLLTANTSLAEMEWMLARAAGYGAGFAMVARPASLRGNPRTPVLLDAIRMWEDARTHHGFDSAQRARLKDPTNEFHLQQTAADAWLLSQYVSTQALVREKVERQPGEPTATAWNVAQTWPTQPLQFRLTVVRGTARNFRMHIDRYAEVAIPVELLPGESLVCDGSNTVQLYDAAGKTKARVTLRTPLPTLAPGTHAITLDSDFADVDTPRIEVHVRGLGTPEVVRARR